MSISRRVLFSAGGLVLLSACGGTLGPPMGDLGQSGSGDASPPPDDLVVPGPTARPTGGDPHLKPEYFIHKGPQAIALTLDDGPHPEWTPKALDLLTKYRITAAFSQVGARVSKYPALVRAVADQGHVIVNHTWTHANLTHLSPAATSAQIERTSDEIEKVSGHRPGIFRAPYGAWSPATFAACRSLGLRTLDWSVDPRDWARPGTGAIVRNILRHTKSGSIILEHDGGGDRSETLAALRVVIPRLLDAGYHFVAP